MYVGVFISIPDKFSVTFLDISVIITCDRLWEQGNRGNNEELVRFHLIFSSILWQNNPLLVCHFGRARKRLVSSKVAQHNFALICLHKTKISKPFRGKRKVWGLGGLGEEMKDNAIFFNCVVISNYFFFKNVKY